MEGGTISTAVVGLLTIAPIRLVDTVIYAITVVFGGLGWT